MDLVTAGPRTDRDTARPVPPPSPAGRDPLNRLVDRLFGHPRAVIGWGIASLVANAGIIVTGAVVRLTGSGMGCPTWPRCTEDSYVPHGELGLHGVIEFGNRLLTFVLIVVAIATAVSAFRARRHSGDGVWVKRRELRRLAIPMGLGIPLQAVVGGIVVWTHLNPTLVAPHLLLSLVLVGLSTIYLRRALGRPRAVTGTWGRRAAYATLVAMAVTLVLGTVVTGSGPHSGDIDAGRNGLDPELMSHVHAVAVYVTVGLTLLTLLLTRSRAAVVLLAVEVAQGVIGFVQYFTGLPEGLVALHLLGAAAAAAAATSLAWAASRRDVADETHVAIPLTAAPARPAPARPAPA